MADKLRLFTLLGEHPASAALKRGEIASDHATLVFDDVKVPNTAFKPLVREAKYDLGELAVVTFLQAREVGKPYALLPVTIMARGQLHTLFYNRARGTLSPRDLAGKRIGARSYTTTTGAWARGMLHELYGIAPDAVHWITFEDSHVAEFRDPPHVERAPAGAVLEDMLLAGEIDAAILAKSDQPEPLAPLLPDAASIDAKWAAEHGGIPINHMLVMRAGIVKARPDVARAVIDMFRLAKETAFPAPRSPDPAPIGIDACRASLEALIAISLAQKLISRPVSVDALFAEAKAALA